MEDCIFCKIASGEIKARIIYDSPDIMAFLDIRPANPGHVLVIPKKHYTILPQIPADLNASLLQLVKVIVQAQVEGLNAQGVNVLQNNGALAGQLVPHVHFHIIPRFKDDKINISWEPLSVTDEELDKLQKVLVENARKIVGANMPSAPKQEVEQEQKEPEEKPKPKESFRLKPRPG